MGTELLVSEHFKGELPPIQDAELMQNFGDFLTQKMYTNNTSNAVIAYHGYLAGYELLAEAANSPEVSALLDEVYEEINQTLVAELHVDPQQQKSKIYRLDDCRPCHTAWKGSASQAGSTGSADCTGKNGIEPWGLSPSDN